jgi:hypothetical protein
MHNSSTIGKYQSRYCDDLRRTKKGRPRGASITKKNSARSLKILLRMPVVLSQFFMVWVRTIPVHARFNRDFFSHPDAWNSSDPEIHKQRRE